MTFDSSKAFSGFAVTDTAAAKDFYENVLGIRVTQNSMGVLELHLRNGAVMIAYPKPHHLPATFTILNFPVGNVEEAVDELVSKGVKFEIYDDEYIKTDEKGIFHGGGPKIAWFKDPAGNIMSVLQQ